MIEARAAFESTYLTDDSKIFSFTNITISLFLHFDHDAILCKVALLKRNRESKSVAFEMPTPTDLKFPFVPFSILLLLAAACFASPSLSPTFEAPLSPHAFGSGIARLTLAEPHLSEAREVALTLLWMGMAAKLCFMDLQLLSKVGHGIRNGEHSRQTYQCRKKIFSGCKSWG